MVEKEEEEKEEAVDVQAPVVAAAAETRPLTTNFSSTNPSGNWFRQKIHSEYWNRLATAASEAAVVPAQQQQQGEEEIIAQEPVVVKVQSPAGKIPTSPPPFGHWFRQKIQGEYTKNRSSTATAPVLEAAAPPSNEPLVSPASSEGTVVAAAARRNIVQPLPPQEEEKMASKYAAIECVGDWASTTLKDLGMVETTLDFSIKCLLPFV